MAFSSSARCSAIELQSRPAIRIVRRLLRSESGWIIEMLVILSRTWMGVSRSTAGRKTMKLLTWYRNNYFIFKGRIGRVHYLKHTLFLIANPLGIYFFQQVVFQLSISLQEDAVIFVLVIRVLGYLGFILDIMLWLTLIILFVGNISLAIRRLHDFNFSGWWLLGYSALAAISGIVSFIGKADSTGLLLMDVVMGLVGLTMVVIPGTPGPNRFETQLASVQTENGP
jgi:uncharacterized membrane protein YhaH (DUF805 family)